MQYDPPDETKVRDFKWCQRKFLFLTFTNLTLEFNLQDYIHRVGRTARGDNGKGSAILFLLPKELQLLIHLKV